MSKEHARAGAFARHLSDLMQLELQLAVVQQHEQAGTWSKDQADAVRLVIEHERAAVNAAHEASLRRIEAGEVEAELAALVVDLERLERASAQLDWQHAVVEQLRTLARKEGGAAAGSAPAMPHLSGCNFIEYSWKFSLICSVVAKYLSTAKPIAP